MTGRLSLDRGSDRRSSAAARRIRRSALRQVLPIAAGVGSQDRVGPRPLHHPRSARSTLAAVSRSKRSPGKAARFGFGSRRTAPRLPDPRPCRPAHRLGRERSRPPRTSADGADAGAHRVSGPDTASRPVSSAASIRTTTDRNRVGSLSVNASGVSIRTRRTASSQACAFCCHSLSPSWAAWKLPRTTTLRHWNGPSTSSTSNTTGHDA